MRIKIKLKTNKLPQLYNNRIQSLIKEAIKLGDPKYKDDLYAKKNPRPFCYSVSFPPQKEIKEGILQIDSKFTNIPTKVFYFDNMYPLLNISSSDFAFLMNLHNGLLKLKKFNFSSDEDMLVDGEKIELILESSIAINKPEIKNDEIVFKTLSPILIQDVNDKQLLPNNDDFINQLNQIQNRIFLNKNIKSEPLYQPLEFTSVKINKKIVKHTLKEFREKTGKPFMFLTCFDGIFKLKGHPKDLELIYNMGLGNRTSQGFGMLEVLG
ncbi:MAG: CRISPR-associated endoribonuclease Cas6 [Candidatus Sericytochromatia bacterium]